MKIFDFFKRLINKEDTDNMKILVSPKQIKQGFYREQGYFPPNSLCKPRTDPEFFMDEEGMYKDNARDGLWVVKDKDGQIKGYTNYSEGVKHGLERSPHGRYTLYHHGQVEMSHIELMRKWKRTVREWKMVKEADKDDRSATLKEFLEAKTTEGKKEVLRKFHASKTPKGQPRLTALKFNKKSSQGMDT